MFSRRPRTDQKFILSQLGLFYALVAALFTIPLLAAVVVVLIKGIIDLRYVILIGGGLLFFGFCFWMVKWGLGFFRNMRQGQEAAARDYRQQRMAGEAVELSFFGGLFKVSYKGRSDGLPPEGGQLPTATRKIPDCGTGAPDLVFRLQALSDLRNAGDIDELEYQKIKESLISDEPMETKEVQ